MSESNNLGRTLAYHCPGFARGGPPRASWYSVPGTLSRARPRVRERLLLEGAGLADLLNQSLGGR
jgi:hypothetical protein